MASSITLYNSAGSPVVVSGENITVSNADGITGATKIGNMVEITQAGYEAITPDANTLYVIVG